MLTQCIALDHGPAGVRANCLCPGWVRTPMADGEMDCARGDRVLAGGRLRDRRPGRAAAPAGTADEIAGTVAWLLSGRVLRQRSRAPGRRRPAVVDVGTLAFGRIA